jgi:hypothetical protein
MTKGKRGEFNKTRRRRNVELKAKKRQQNWVDERGEIERSDWRQSREEDLQCPKGAAEPSLRGSGTKRSIIMNVL